MSASPPLADTSRAMSGRGVAVACEAELNQAVAEIGSAEGPLLIEMILNPPAVPRFHLWPDWTERRANDARWMSMKLEKVNGRFIKFNFVSSLVSINGGGPWNRTRRGSPRRSYSPLPHLAARPPSSKRLPCMAPFANRRAE